MPTSRPELTAELLLAITRDVKFGFTRKELQEKLARNLMSEDVKVTNDEIEAVADAMKWNVFFVPGYVIRKAMELNGTLAPVAVDYLG
jgi:hypothetical protein